MSIGAQAITLIGQLWPKLEWTPEQSQLFAADVDRLGQNDPGRENGIGWDQAKACIEEVRRNSRHKSVSQGEVYKALRALKYQPLAPVEITTTKPYLTASEIDRIVNGRIMPNGSRVGGVPEWAGWSAWQVCAKWYSDVGVFSMGGEDIFRAKLRKDLKYHGCPSHMIERAIDRAVETNYDRDPEAQKAHEKMMREHPYAKLVSSTRGAK